jgi:hypothetical protein
MKIFWSVSAILLSDVAIASPLRAHQGFSRAIIIPHVASRLKSVNVIEEQEVRFVDKDRPTSFVEPTKVVTNVLAAAIFLKNFSPTLALLQHSPRDRTLECGHRLYLGSRKVKILLGKDPVN